MQLTKINDSNFDNEVIKSDKLVLVKFSANWCAPCRAMEPILEEAYQDIGVEKVKFTKLDIDDNSTIAQKFGIRSIPTVIIFKDGKVIDKKVGSLEKDSLKKWVQDKLLLNN